MAINALFGMFHTGVGYCLFDAGQSRASLLINEMLHTFFVVITCLLEHGYNCICDYIMSKDKLFVIDEKKKDFLPYHHTVNDSITVYIILLCSFIVFISSCNTDDMNNPHSGKSSKSFPSVTIGSDHISAISAVLQGKANIGSTMAPNLEMGILYSTSSGVIASNSIKVKATDMDSKYNYSVNISGLEPATTYYYRSYVTQNNQDTYGETLSFTTKELSSMLTTLEATEIEATSARLNAKLDLTDVLHQTKEWGFNIGASEADLSTTIKGGDITENAYAVTIKGLPHKTQYWYKSFVILDNRTYYGELKTLTTDVIHVSSVSLDKTNYVFHSVGETMTLGATILPIDATEKKVEWSTSNEAVAIVSANGQVKAISNGTAIISVNTLDQNKTASCEISVAQNVTDITLNKSSVSLNEGDTQQLNATVTPDNAFDKTLTWSSSNESVATVDENGKVKAISKGTATIKVTAEDGSGVSASCSVTVIRLVSSIVLDKTSIIIYNNKSEALSATVIPSSATKTGITWSSSNTSVAMVSNSGIVTGISRGTTTITATAQDESNVKAICDVEVKQYVTDIKLNKTSLSLNKGETETLDATISPDNANNKTLIWTSSDTSVATVDQYGNVKGVSAFGGSVTITATANDGSGISASCKVSVLGAIDLGLSVKWSNHNLDASHPEEYGKYYAWGENEPKNEYSWLTYKWCTRKQSGYVLLTKYNNNNYNGSIDNTMVLDIEDDAAHVKYGGYWRIPTRQEIDELLQYCTWEKLTMNGVNGYKVTSKMAGYTDKWIFLPAAGYMDNMSLYSTGSSGFYWSSSLHPNDSYCAYYLIDKQRNNTNFKYDEFGHNRSQGFSIRPVCD